MGIVSTLLVVASYLGCEEESIGERWEGCVLSKEGGFCFKKNVECDTRGVYFVHILPDDQFPNMALRFFHGANYFRYGLCSNQSR